jgi:hypothetical protein
MPKKQMRESIEAELNSSEVEHAVARLQDAACARIRRDLAETADTEISALDQLMTILDGRRGH